MLIVRSINYDPGLCHYLNPTVMIEVACTDCTTTSSMGTALFYIIQIRFV